MKVIWLNVTRPEVRNDERCGKTFDNITLQKSIATTHNVKAVNRASKSQS